MISISILFLSISCKDRDRERGNYLSTRVSLRLEAKVIEDFFKNEKLNLKLKETKHVNPYRIFLHNFNAEKDDIEKIVKILKLKKVSKEDFKKIHNKEYVNADYKVYSEIGKNYLKRDSIHFYKAELNNKTAQEKLRISKVYLYYDSKNKKACFQVYHSWG